MLRLTNPTKYISHTNNNRIKEHVIHQPDIYAPYPFRTRKPKK